MTTEQNLDLRVNLKGEDPVATLADAIAEVERLGFDVWMIAMSSTVLEYAPFVMGGPQRPDKKGWSVTVRGRKAVTPPEVQEKEVERDRYPDDPTRPDAAPSDSPCGKQTGGFDCIMAEGHSGPHYFRTQETLL